MNEAQWLLYGAYGYTGRLIIEEALKRNHHLTLAGRNAKKLQPLAEKYNLDWMAFNLDDVAQVAKFLTPFELVMHAAGPFTFTSDPMIQACIASKTHYLDITGEIDVFENSFVYDEQAKEKGIVIISGVGFDIVPSDCLLKYVADKLPTATHLELGIKPGTSISGGTLKTSLEGMPHGSARRVAGKIERVPFGKDSKKILYSDGKRNTSTLSPWGDLSTAETSTGIPNLEIYMVIPTGPVVTFTSNLMKVSPIRKLAQSIIDKAVDGPDEEARKTGKTYLYAKAWNEIDEAEAWLETMEGYQLTAESSVRAIERVLDNNLNGTLTPSLAFGTDYILEFDKSMRFDSLPNR